MNDTRTIQHSTLKYRPAIDGLRAFAVLSVFFFHLNRKWLPGGFVGVDVFFVISGYLISSLILKDLEAGRFSLKQFYQRRIARIFPAFFVVAFATLAAASVIYSPQDLASTGATLTAAALSVANMKFMLQGNYFTLSPDAQPFLHYWSLSVEEQFYFIYPLLVMLAFRFARRRLGALLAVGWILSFAACVILTARRPVWAFYLLPARAWELLAGGLIAVYAGHLAQGAAARWRGWLQPLGLLVILASFLLVREGDTFPGFWALLPVLGTAAVIVPPPGGKSAWEKVLSVGPLVLMGQMSYSLYLWHWPVFSFVDYGMYLASEWTRLIVKIGLTLPLAYLSYRYVEGPARSFLSRPTSTRLAYASLAVVLALVVPAGIQIRRTNYVNAEPDSVANGGLVFDYGSKAGSVVLMGDSNGSMYAKALKDVCAEQHCRLTVISVAAGDPLPTLGGSQNQLWLDSLALVQKERPDYVFLAYSWAAKLKGGESRIDEAVERLSPYAGHIVLLNQPPTIPRSATRASMREGARPPFVEEPPISQSRKRTNEYLRHLESPKVSVLDVASHFEGRDGSLRVLDPQGRELFQDEGHLSAYGADWVRGELARAISESAHSRPN